MKVNPAKVWLRLVFASTVDGLWAELFSKKRVCISTMYAAEPYVAQEDSGGSMYLGKPFSRFSMAALLTAALLLGDRSGLAQTKPGTMPDAQIEANVLKALAGAPELADQSITSTTVYGTVTLNGTVRDEPSRDLAEHLVANTAGVQKVVDQLVIGTPGAAVTSDSQSGASNPNLQSDGTVAPT